MLNLEGDVDSRQKWNPEEPPILSRLVVLRVALNHEFGSAFHEYDHELAQIEMELSGLLLSRLSEIRNELIYLRKEIEQLPKLLRSRTHVPSAYDLGAKR